MTRETLLNVLSELLSYVNQPKQTECRIRRGLNILFISVILIILIILQGLDKRCQQNVVGYTQMQSLGKIGTGLNDSSRTDATVFIAVRSALQRHLNV